MKVLLLKNVPKVGKKDEIVEVTLGYAQNALFPQKVAIPATEDAIRARDRKLQNTKALKEIHHQLLDKAIEHLAGTDAIYEARANDQGNLFSKIHVTDIASFLETKYRISIDPQCIVLPEPIKRVGNHTIVVADAEYQSKFTLHVINKNIL